MNILALTQEFNLELKRVGESTDLKLNKVTICMTDDELEELEYNLANLSHAISMYKRSIKNGK